MFLSHFFHRLVNQLVATLNYRNLSRIYFTKNKATGLCGNIPSLSPGLISPSCWFRFWTYDQVRSWSSIDSQWYYLKEWIFQMPSLDILVWILLLHFHRNGYWGYCLFFAEKPRNINGKNFIKILGGVLTSFHENSLERCWLLAWETEKRMWWIVLQRMNQLLTGYIVWHLRC